MNNVKKIVAGAAALGVGALMITGAFAATNVTPEGWTTDFTRGDFFRETGVPSVSVVVGSTAQPSDFIWAGNIAAAIGAKSYVAEGEIEGGFTFNNVQVTVGTEGVTTISGDGKLVEFESMGATTYPVQRIRNQEFSKLFNKEITYRDADNTSQKLRVAEEILFAPEDVYFVRDNDVQKIVAMIPDGVYDHDNISNSEGLIYRVTLGSGLDEFDSLDSDDRTNIEIPFLGRTYKIQSFDGDMVKLVTSDAKAIYNQGDDFTVEGYRVNVGTITSGTTDNKVLLRLYDGETLLASESLGTDDTTDFNGYLEEEIIITDVQYASDQLGYIEVTTAEGVLELTHGDVIEEFDVELGNNTREWEAHLEIDVGDKLRAIAVINKQGWDVDVEDDFQGLRIGDNAVLPLDFASVNFVGLKSEPRYLFETTTNRITWSDDSDFYDIPILATNRKSGTNPSMTVEIDGYNYYFTYHTSGALEDNLVIRDVDDDEDDDAIIEIEIYTADENSSLGDLWTWETGDAELDFSGDVDYYFIGIPSEGTDATHYYYVRNDFSIGTQTHFGMALSAKLEEYDVDNVVKDPVDDPKSFDVGLAYTLGKNANWGFIGSIEAGDDGDYAALYYDIEAEVETVLAEFKFVDNDDSVITAYFDPNRNRRRLADIRGSYTGDYESAEIENVNRKVFYLANAGANYNFSLDNYESDDIQEGITLSGAILAIENNQLVIDMPEDVQEVQFFIGGDLTTDTTISGATFTLTTPGEVVEEDGIEVVLDNYNIEGAEGAIATIPSGWKPSTQAAIIRDTETTANTKIIIGGWMVNKAAEGLNLEDAITATGQYVYGRHPQGHVVVAGMTANDTAEAAKMLLAAIENM